MHASAIRKQQEKLQASPNKNIRSEVACTNDERLEQVTGHVQSKQDAKVQQMVGNVRERREAWA